MVYALSSLRGSRQVGLLEFLALEEGLGVRERAKAAELRRIFEYRTKDMLGRLRSLDAQGFIELRDDEVQITESGRRETVGFADLCRLIRAFSKAMAAALAISSLILFMLYTLLDWHEAITYLFCLTRAICIVENWFFHRYPRTVYEGLRRSGR